jgi:hypothetical protein
MITPIAAVIVRFHHAPAAPSHGTLGGGQFREQFAQLPEHFDRAELGASIAPRRDGSIPHPAGDPHGKALDWGVSGFL